MIIPPEQLAPETLQRLIEDFVTRDGTDNGDSSSLAQRVELVRRALQKKEALILFDVLSEQCRLCLKRDIPREVLAELLAGAQG